MGREGAEDLISVGNSTELGSQQSPVVERKNSRIRLFSKNGRVQGILDSKKKKKEPNNISFRSRIEALDRE